MPASAPLDPGAIAGPDGRFRMLAIDQRESLRTLLAAAGRPSADTDLTAFKVAVARTLSPAATGMLIDRDYGLDAVVAADAVGRGLRAHRRRGPAHPGARCAADLERAGRARP